MLYTTKLPYECKGLYFFVILDSETQLYYAEIFDRMGKVLGYTRNHTEASMAECHARKLIIRHNGNEDKLEKDSELIRRDDE
jgi:hypothetical protein